MTFEQYQGRSCYLREVGGGSGWGVVREGAGQGRGQGQDHLGLGCYSKDFGFHLEGCETIRGPVQIGAMV